MTHLRAAVRLTAATLTALGWGSTYAQPDSGWRPNAVELSQLPVYCQAQFNPAIQVPPGEGPTGCGGFFNHFCPAWLSLNRASAFSAPKAERRFALGNAKNHLAYTRKHMPATCSHARELELLEMRAKLLESSLR
jgi:hypothetical protein